MFNTNQYVQGLKARDEAAFDAIYHQYAGLVYHVIVFIVRDSAEAEDLTQDTFVTLMNNVDRLDAGKNLKYFILQIAKNLALDHLRKTKNTSELAEPETIAGEDRQHASGEGFAAFMEKYRVFLQDEEFDIIVLHLYYDLKFREIAAMKNKTVKAVNGIYDRGITKIRQHARREDLDE